MFEGQNEKNPISIGRIIFAVFGFLDYFDFSYLLFVHEKPSHITHDWGGMALGMLGLGISLLLTLIGAVITIQAKVRHRPALFWLCASVVVSLPFVYGLLR